jgi:uncharacterized protein (TIGR03435 family)
VQKKGKRRARISAVFGLCLASLLSSADVGPLAAQAGPDETFLQFEVSSVKPTDPNGGGRFGYSSQPGGRIFIGAQTLKSLVADAFGVQDFQVIDASGWMASERYDLAAVLPDSMKVAAQNHRSSYPTAEERLMLRNLLTERFNLQTHSSKKYGNILLLERGTGPLRLQPPKNPEHEPATNVFVRGNIADGESFGMNTSMAFLAMHLSGDLERPVIDETHLEGSYDFHTVPTDPNNTDIGIAVLSAMKQIGLQVKSGKGMFETIVIDQARHLSAD